MKVLIGLVVSVLVGAGCRFFDIPVPSPPVLPGALLVLAMTLGYSGMDRVMVGRAQPSTTSELCGGPTGAPAKKRTDSGRPESSSTRP